MKNVTTTCITFHKDFILYGCDDGSCYALYKNDHNKRKIRIKTMDNDSVRQIEVNRPYLYILCCNYLYIYIHKPNDQGVSFELEETISVSMSCYNNMIRQDNCLIIACSRIPEEHRSFKTGSRKQIINDGCFILINLETHGYRAFINPHEDMHSINRGVKIDPTNEEDQLIQTDIEINIGGPNCVTKGVVNSNGKPFFLSGGKEGKIKLWNLSKSRNVIKITAESLCLFDLNKSVLSIRYEKDKIIFCVTSDSKLSIMKTNSLDKWIVHKEFQLFQFTTTFTSFYTLLRFHHCGMGLLIYGSLMKKKKTMSFIKMIRKQPNADYDLVNILLDTNKINSIEADDSKLLVSVSNQQNSTGDCNLIHESVYKKSVKRLNNCPDNLYYMDSKYLYVNDLLSREVVDHIGNLSIFNEIPTSLNEIRLHSIIRYYRGHEFMDNMPPYLIEYLEPLLGIGL